MIVPADKVNHTPGGSDIGFERVLDDKTRPFPDDRPPSYTPSNASIPPHSPSSSTSILRPANMLAISQNNSAIRGTFIIDPTLVIPESVLPVLPCGEERVNVSLHSNNGAISADIRIVPTPGASRPLGPRTSVAVSSRNGSLVVKIKRPEGEPVSLSTQSWNGKTTIYLPRSFNGPVSMSTLNGKVVPSATMVPSTTIFSETSRSKKWFIGDPAGSGWSANPEHWLGDELHVDSMNGKVLLMYADEEELSSQPDEPRKLSKDKTSKFGVKFGQDGQWGVGFWDDKS